MGCCRLEVDEVEPFEDELELVTVDELVSDDELVSEAVVDFDDDEAG